MEDLPHKRLGLVQLTAVEVGQHEQLGDPRRYVVVGLHQRCEQASSLGEALLLDQDLGQGAVGRSEIRTQRGRPLEDLLGVSHSALAHTKISELPLGLGIVGILAGLELHQALVQLGLLRRSRRRSAIVVDQQPGGGDAATTLDHRADDSLVDPVAEAVPHTVTEQPYDRDRDIAGKVQ